jgi:hypothetical protein
VTSNGHGVTRSGYDVTRNGHGVVGEGYGITRNGQQGMVMVLQETVMVL